MKDYDYWTSFIKTGRIDDYLHYIACTKEEVMEEPVSFSGRPGQSGPGYEDFRHWEDVYNNTHM
jgi:hypothetical protein